MPRKGHSEEQIIAALKQYESGDKVAEICRKLGVSEATFYTWKKQYTGLGVQRAARAETAAGGERQAEAAGGRSLARPADPAGDRLKKAVKPRQRCRLARWAQEAYHIGAALRAFVAGAVDHPDLQEPEETAKAAAQASARDRGDVCALRLSSSDGATETRRLEDRRQAGLPPL